MKDGPRLYPLNGRTGVIYAGRCDLVAKVDGKPYVVDFKTGTRPKKDPYYEWRLQTAAYRFALPQHELKGNAVLHLDKVTGLPTWYDFSDSYADDIIAWGYLIRYYCASLKGKYDPSKEAPSVTSACGVLDKSGPLMWWATECMEQYASMKLLELHKHRKETEPGEPLFGLSDVLGIIDESKRNYRKVAKEAADIGSQVHACIEGFLRTGVEPTISDDRILAGFVAFLEWKDTVHLEVIAQEVVCYG